MFLDQVDYLFGVRFIRMYIKGQPQYQFKQVWSIWVEDTNSRNFSIYCKILTCSSVSFLNFVSEVRQMEDMYVTYVGGFGFTQAWNNDLSFMLLP